LSRLTCAGIWMASQIVVSRVHDLLASHTDDVMVLGCHRIVSHTLVKRCQPRDNSVPLERVESLVDCRVRKSRVAWPHAAEDDIGTGVRLVTRKSLGDRQTLRRDVQSQSFALLANMLDVLTLLLVQSICLVLHSNWKIVTVLTLVKGHSSKDHHPALRPVDYRKLQINQVPLTGSARCNKLHHCTRRSLDRASDVWSECLKKKAPGYRASFIDRRLTSRVSYAVESGQHFMKHWGGGKV
jgi:hypothetical protein